jgi:hypothetical protein
LDIKKPPFFGMMSPGPTTLIPFPHDEAFGFRM